MSFNNSTIANISPQAVHKSTKSPVGGSKTPSPTKIPSRHSSPAKRSVSIKDPGSGRESRATPKDDTEEKQEEATDRPAESPARSPSRKSPAEQPPEEGSPKKKSAAGSHQEEAGSNVDNKGDP